MCRKLLGMPPDIIAREREQCIETRVCSTKNALVEKSEHTNITAQRQRSKVELKESGRFINAEVVQERTLQPIEPVTIAERCMIDDRGMVFNQRPYMRFELVEQLGNPIPPREKCYVAARFVC